MYIFLLEHLFYINHKILIDLGKNLGFSKFKSFYNYITCCSDLQLLLVLSLVAMETLAEFGAVDFFSINTLTTGIYNSWITFDDLAFANRISFFLIIIYIFIICVENLSRRKAKYHFN